MNSHYIAQLGTAFVHIVIGFYRYVTKLTAWTTPTAN